MYINCLIILSIFLLYMNTKRIFYKYIKSVFIRYMYDYEHFYEFLFELCKQTRYGIVYSII